MELTEIFTGMEKGADAIQGNFDAISGVQPKVTVLPSPTTLNGVGIWKTDIDNNGILVEFENFAIANFTAHLTGITLASFKSIEVIQYPISYFSAYKHFINSPAKYSLTKGNKWVSFEVSPINGKLTIAAKDSALSADETELNYTMFMTK